MSRLAIRRCWTSFGIHEGVIPRTLGSRKREIEGNIMIIKRFLDGSHVMEIKRVVGCIQRW
jgi:hypothetical protein